MKIILIVATLLVAYVAAEEKECPMKKMMMESYQKCVEELNSSDEAQENVKTGKGEDDKESNELRGCAMQKAGLINEGKIDYEKMETMMRSDKEADLERIDGVLAAFNACKDECETSTDNGVVAGNYTKCLKALEKEAGKEKS